jgi:DNA-3-methyladenine glycosylase II
MSRKPIEMLEIAQSLAEQDERLAKVIANSPLCTLAQSKNKVSNFEALVESVVSQQLSIKAADTIYGRLFEAANSKMTPESVASIEVDIMRACGLSGSKTKTIKGLAEAALSEKVNFETLQDLDDDTEIATKLTQLWGIGAWTVDMFMMHQLGRLDIWPTGDLGVRRGWEKMNGLQEQISPSDLNNEGERFRPYRSVVAWYCWRAVEI